MRTHDYDELAPVVQELSEAIVWCSMTTVGPDQHPRARVVHPVWDWASRPLRGWVTSRPTPLKRAHLAGNPGVTCAYFSPTTHDLVMFDCDAAWAPAAELERRWHDTAAVPPPMGFDPATIWPEGPGSHDFAVIDLRPHRITVQTGAALARGEKAMQWRASGSAAA